MSTYKVLKDFPGKKRMFKAGEIVERPANHPRTELLLQEGYIESPYGVTVDAWEREGIVSKLANILIAPEDYAEGDRKHFTWDEAMKIEKKLPAGWRLPTRRELVLICEELACDKSGRLSPDLLENRLKFEKNGFTAGDALDGSSFPYNVGSGGYYWSSTAANANNAYNLNFNSGGSYPADSNARYNGFSVRCVKDLEGEDGKG